MKNKNGLLINMSINTLFSLVIGLMLLSINACSLFTTDKLTDYLNKNENTIAVVDAQFENEYPTDADDVTSIPSNADCKITYLVRNPLGLTIVPVVTNVADGNSVLSGLSDCYSYESSDDNNYITVTLSKEMLSRMEKGGEVSPVVSLTAEDYSGEVEKYCYSIRANTPPLFVQGACVMVDSAYETSASKGYYVLCFNIPQSYFDSTGIDCDASKIYITGLDASTAAKYGKGYSLNIDTTAKTHSLPSNLSATLVQNTYNQQKAVSFIADKYPVYITTKTVAAYNDNLDFTIKIVDAKGLSSSVTVNTNSLQLSPVTTNITKQTKQNDGSYTIALVDSNGNAVNYFTAVLTAPTTTNSPTDLVSQTTIVYKIYSVSGSTELLLTQDSSSNPVGWDCKAGKYRIEAYARKDGYVDSKIQSWSFTVGT
jgi:hypothetical protein